ncbi:MAG: hypothetical protein KF746_01905 [Chitinophagaceae bacterium]|nr:hypothetical protein [Chitinophagaceae bacterium]
MEKIINRLLTKPKMLFLTDALGAMLTVFLLFAVLRNFKEYFGMPETILIYLSIIAAVFCIYSSACFFFLKGNWAPFIRGISYANLLYCMLTSGLLLVYYPVLTAPGIAYFLAEIVIVFGLVYIELRVAAAVSQNRTDHHC